MGSLICFCIQPVVIHLFWLRWKCNLVSHRCVAIKEMDILLSSFRLWVFFFFDIPKFNMIVFLKLVVVWNLKTEELVLCFVMLQSIDLVCILSRSLPMNDFVTSFIDYLKILVRTFQLLAHFSVQYEKINVLPFIL